MNTESQNHKSKQQDGQRPTEPLPSNYKPALLFLLFIFGVIVFMASAAYIADRMFYG